MSHPFTRLFDTALNKSSLDNNLVLKEAEKIKEKGYRPEEILGVLNRLHEGLIDDGESEIVGEAVEEFSRYVD